MELLLVDRWLGYFVLVVLWFVAAVLTPKWRDDLEPEEKVSVVFLQGAVYFLSALLLVKLVLLVLLT